MPDWLWWLLGGTAYSAATFGLAVLIGRAIERGQR